MDQSLLVFIAVADHQNFTRAAEALHMSQPAVSAHIQSLEKEVGVKLLDRTNKFVKLNKAGEIVYHHAQQILAIYTRMGNLLDDLKHTASGALAIGSSYTFGEYILPHIIAKLRESYPMIQPSITIENSSTIIDLIHHQQLDIGIIEGGDFPSDRARVTPFMQDKMSIVLSSAHPLASKETLTPADLAEETWIVRESGSGTRELQDHALKQLGISPKSLMVFGSTQVIKESLEAGLGISLISETTMQKELKLGLFILPKLDGFPMTRSFSFVLPKGDFQTKATEVFIQLLQSMHGKNEERV